jgi:CheY-like chemotaxis protein
MGGEIIVTSTEGKGSVFMVELPLAETDNAVAARTFVVERPQFGLRALVAEDDAVNRFVFRRQLQRLGISCVMVEDGRQAVTALDESIDLVFLDVRMPVMSGLEAAAIIRQRNDRLSRVPICALTADAAAEDTARSLAAGMDAHLSKPLTMDDLVQVIAGTLGFSPDEAAIAPGKQMDPAADDFVSTAGN